MANTRRAGSKIVWRGESDLSSPFRLIPLDNSTKPRDRSKNQEQSGGSAHPGSGRHFLVRLRGIPLSSNRLGQISFGVAPSSRAIIDSIAGHGRFSALPAAVG